MRPVIGFNYGAKGIWAGQADLPHRISDDCCHNGGGHRVVPGDPRLTDRSFTENAATVAAGKTALRIISGGFIVSAVSVTASGALEGLGKGTPSLVISLCRYLVIIVPLAFLLSRVLGAAGVWHAFWITELFTAGIALAVYRKAVQIKV